MVTILFLTILALSNTANMKVTPKYNINDTLVTDAGFIVTVVAVISRIILKVSYGLDSNGKDIQGLINVNIHLSNTAI